MVVHAHYPLGEPRVEREAEALVEQGYSVEVICLRHPSEPAIEIVGGVKIYRVPVHRHKGWGPLRQFFEYLAFFLLAFLHLTRFSSRYSIVHVHNLPDFLVFAALMPRLRGARIILDIHDLMPEFYLSRFGHRGSRWADFLLRLQEKLACRFAHHVITVTEPWRQILVQRSVPAHKCSVVMNVPGDRFRRGAAQLPEKRASYPFHLIYHGTLAHRYGIDLAIRAVARIRQQVPGLHFTIHGRGEYLSDLQRLVKELDLVNHVSFSTRYIPMDDLPAFLSTADVGIVPYRHDVFTDGILPTKLMEYVALGIPVIASRTSAITTYFDDSMLELFPPGDISALARCILRLYRDPSHRATLAQNANRFNQMYTWEHQSARLIELANRLANTRRP